MKAYYQPRGGKKSIFALRDNTYKRIWYLIADYPYFLACRAGYVKLEKFKDEKHSQTEDEAISLANFEIYIKAIEDAEKEIPEVYRDFILNHIINKTKYSEFQYAHEQTLKMWLQKFIWHVAKNLGEI